MGRSPTRSWGLPGLSLYGELTIVLDAGAAIADRISVRFISDNVVGQEL